MINSILFLSLSHAAHRRRACRFELLLTAPQREEREREEKGERGESEESERREMAREERISPILGDEAAFRGGGGKVGYSKVPSRAGWRSFPSRRADVSRRAAGNFRG